LNDEAIVIGLRKHDKEAITFFWRIYYDKVYPICAFILGQGPDAGDMTVDILVDFIEKRVDNLASPKALYSFLRHTAVRRSIRFRDRRNKLSHVESDEHVSGEASPEEKAELNMLMPFLQQCLDKMTPKARTTLRLKYTKKISNEQIGEIVGGSKSYIGRILKQGEKTLRRCIEKKVKEAAMYERAGNRWSSVPKPVVSISVIETLLKQKMCHVEDECSSPLQMAAAVLKTDEPEHRAWVEEHISSCSLCRKSLLLLQAMESRGDDLPIQSIPNRTAQMAGHRLLKGMAIAAGLLLALSVVYISVFLQTPSPRPGEGLTVKGGSDGFFVAVQRGRDSFTLRPLDKLIEDDKLGLFYSTGQSGYLAVFSMDTEGEATLLYPANGKKSSRITRGKRIPLEDGALVGVGTGCEWLAAVFSEKPLSIDDILHTLEAAKRGDEKSGCRLTATVPGARTVLVLPVIR
jgi:RNA polymerase sigma factor (sigma-70 family)